MAWVQTIRWCLLNQCSSNFGEHKALGGFVKGRFCFCRSRVGPKTPQFYQAVLMLLAHGPCSDGGGTTPHFPWLRLCPSKCTKGKVYIDFKCLNSLKLVLQQLPLILCSAPSYAHLYTQESETERLREGLEILVLGLFFSQVCFWMDHIPRAGWAKHRKADY